MACVRVSVSDFKNEPTPIDFSPEAFEETFCAKKARERAACPMAGKIIPTEATHCDTCGDELALVSVGIVPPSTNELELH